MLEFDKRINLNITLEELSKHVCLKYDLGSFESCQLIEIGYEDYNFVLQTSNGKYVVKVFSNKRTDNEAKELAERAEVAYEQGVACPKIYKTKNSFILITTIKKVKYRLVVMEYIDGKDFFTLNQLPTLEELKEIAKQIAKLNCIKYSPPFIYDNWAIVNFNKEYALNIKYIEDEDKPLLEKAYKDFNKCDFSKLRYGFVHGDIIETNVIKDKTKKLYIIDFSVSNYLPIIVDLAVTICDLCLDLTNIDITKKRIKNFLNAYEKVLKLFQYEKECLKVFIECHQAITLLETSREKFVNNNNSIENDQFFNKGKFSIKIVNENVFF